jgi:diguanylate cyclase (GGDEF) domain
MISQLNHILGEVIIGLKRVLITAVVLLALIPTIFVGLTINYYAQNTIREEKLDTMTVLARMMDIHLTQYYDRLIGDIQMKAENDVFLDLLESGGTREEGSPDAGKIQSILLKTVGFPVISGSVIDTNGKTVFSSQSGETGLMLNKTELYKSIIGGKSSYVGMVSTNVAADVLEIAVPIKDEMGRTVGILKQNADIDLLRDYLGTVSFGKSGYAFLIRENGTMIFDNKRTDKSILYNEYQDNNSLERLVSDLKSGRLKDGSGSVEYHDKGVDYIGSYESVYSLDCVVVVAAERNEMLGAMMRFRAILMVVSLCVMVLVAVFVYFIGCMQIAPLRMLNDTLKKIATGDLTARSNLKGGEELEELSRNINNLADNYQKSEKELRMSSRVDNLTHLLNRNAIYEVLDTFLYKHPNQALLFLDLEGFKNVNDNLGYDIGDRILIEVGNILRELPQHVCYPSRLGGAEFLIFITNWSAQKYPEKIAEKIINKIIGIRFIDEIHVDISSNIGIEYTDDERIDKKKLIKHSNIAMHKARSIGRNSYFVHYPYLQKET